MVMAGSAAFDIEAAKCVRGLSPRSEGSLTSTDAGEAPERRSPSASTSGSEQHQDALRLFDARCFVPEFYDIAVTDRYDVERRALATGGYGSVHFARDKRFKDRVVAVKRTQHLRSGELELERREAAFMRELDHPAICRLFEIYESASSSDLVMEFCEGGDLYDRIIAEGKLSESLTAEVVMQVSSALKYAHARNIAHRDVKPENVCFCSPVRADNRVQLIDWGLAASTLTVMKTSVGSAEYQAPEVLLSKSHQSYSNACDLWSLGVVTAVMLSARPAFLGSFQQRLAAMKAEADIFVGPPWQSVSSDAKDLIRGLVRYKPEERTPLDDLYRHPFLSRRADVMSLSAKAVFARMVQFSQVSELVSFCAASTARHSEHQSLQTIQRLFLELDADKDGFLDVDELRSGFELVYGTDSAEYEHVGNTFAGLDLGAAGKISYTEFCAAAIGQEACAKDRALWLGFIGLTGLMSGIRNGTRLLELPVELRQVAFEIQAREGIRFGDFKSMVQATNDDQQRHDATNRQPARAEPGCFPVLSGFGEWLFPFRPCSLSSMFLNTMR